MNSTLSAFRSLVDELMVRSIQRQANSHIQATASSVSPVTPDNFENVIGLQTGIERWLYCTHQC